MLFVQGKGHGEKDDFVVIAHAESALRDWLGVRGNKQGSLFCFKSLSWRAALIAVIPSHDKRLHEARWRARQEHSLSEAYGNHKGNL